LSDGEYERIAKSDESSITDEVKRTALGRGMFASVNDSGMKGMDKFARLQTSLDIYSYAVLDKALDANNRDIARIRGVLKKEIDAKNIMTMERMKQRGFEKTRIKNYLIKGGTLDSGSMNSLIGAKDLASTIKLIRNKFPKFSAKEGELSLSELEIALEKMITSEKIKAFERSVLSIGVVLGFILLKEEELNNIRKIAKAKEYNLSEQETREMIVVI
jgi:V/A-type H+-transporting ATPase subunit C